MLIKCPECGEQISDQAGACPHCGAPVEGSKTNMGTKPGLTVRRGVVWFSALVIVLVDVVLYVVGRLILMFTLRHEYNIWWDSPSWRKFVSALYAERILVLCAGGLLVLVIAVLASHFVRRPLGVVGTRPLTVWLLGGAVTMGMVVTCVSAWALWAGCYLPLPSSFFPELPSTWVYWGPHSYSIPGYAPGQWWLIPLVSGVFLLCSLVAVTVRAVYVRLFEKPEG